MISVKILINRYGFEVYVKKLTILTGRKYALPVSSVRVHVGITASKLADSYFAFAETKNSPVSFEG